MHTNSSPHTYTLDLVAGNGKTYSFEYTPTSGDKAVRYYDCGISLAPGDQDYATSSSDGYPLCAPPMSAAMFNPAAKSGIASHTEDDRWDIDRRTVRFVGAWIDYINESKGI